MPESEETRKTFTLDDDVGEMLHKAADRRRGRWKKGPNEKEIVNAALRAHLSRKPPEWEPRTPDERLQVSRLLRLLRTDVEAAQPLRQTVPDLLAGLDRLLSEAQPEEGDARPAVKKVQPS